jgi:hypothetical protein
MSKEAHKELPKILPQTILPTSGKRSKLAQMKKERKNILYWTIHKEDL